MITESVLENDMPTAAEVMNQLSRADAGSIITKLVSARGAIIDATQGGYLNEAVRCYLCSNDFASMDQEGREYAFKAITGFRDIAKRIGDIIYDANSRAIYSKENQQN
jgi:hypothetical protein